MNQHVDPSPSARARRYRGGCACKAVSYEVALGPTQPWRATSSVWLRRVPGAAFRLLAGGERLVGYQFAAEPVHHFYCERCESCVYSYGRAADGDWYTIDLKELHSAASTETEVAARFPWSAWFSPCTGPLRSRAP